MEQVTPLLNEEQYVVRNLKEIIQILNDLVKQKAMIKVSFNSGADDCLTTIIEVDTKNHAVYLDIGQDEIFNSRLLAGHYIDFSKDSGVRVKWTSPHVTMVTLKDGRAIKIALPDSVVRLQRREFFRLTTPIVNPVSCQIPITDDANPVLTRSLTLHLADISLGGVCLLAHDPLDAALEVGATFSGCKLILPDVGAVNLTLQVRSVIPTAMKDGTMKYRIGLLYVKPSPSDEIFIHRYTSNLEREFCSRSWAPVA